MARTIGQPVILIPAGYPPVAKLVDAVLQTTWTESVKDIQAASVVEFPSEYHKIIMGYSQQAGAEGGAKPKDSEVKYYDTSGKAYVAAVKEVIHLDFDKVLNGADGKEANVVGKGQVFFVVPKTQFDKAKEKMKEGSEISDPAAS